MIQGIEILSQEIVPIMTPNLSLFWWTYIGCIIFGIFMCWVVEDIEILGMCAFFGLFLSVIICLCLGKQIGEYTQYKVTISDKVNFVEFNSKYEIEEQDGKIYTIRERDKTK